MPCAKTGYLWRIDTPRGPYQVWSGDRFECPVGGESVIVGNGSIPVADQHEDDFAEWSERAQTVVVVQ
jgi:hypothetical protein